MSSRTRPINPDSPPKLRRSNRDKQKRAKDASSKGRRVGSQLRDNTPLIRNSRQVTTNAPLAGERDGRGNRSARMSHRHDHDKNNSRDMSDYDSDGSSASESSASSATSASSGSLGSLGSNSDNSSGCSSEGSDTRLTFDTYTTATSAEEEHDKYAVAAKRKVKKQGDKNGVISPAVGAGWPKKSLLEAASSRIDDHKNIGGKKNDTLKSARANAVARRERTAMKLQQQQKQKQQQQKRRKGAPPKSPPTSTPKTAKSEVSRNKSSLERSPNTPITLDTTMSSTTSADLSPPPPASAKAYNRFFPPPKLGLVETNDTLGSDKVLNFDPNAATGEIEIYTEEKYYTTSTKSEASYESYGASQWAMIAEMMAKKEPLPDVDREEVFSQASLPTALNNGDIFHESATQAVASLLSLPRHKNRSRGRAFGNNDDASSVVSGTSAYSSSAYSTTLTASAVCETPKDNNGTTPFISQKTAELVDLIPSFMNQPSKQLCDLISVIHISEARDYDQPMTTAVTRGKMTRRMNACGALKLLAAKPDNCIQLAWTVGVVSSLTSVLADSPFNYVDKATYNSFLVARERAVDVLVPMSVAVENRILMLHVPGLVHSLIKTIDEDDGPCRLGCMTILTHLSKAVENRLLLAQTPGLIDSLVHIISGISPEHMKENADGIEDSRTSKDEHRVRANAFAILLFLSQEKDNAYLLARNYELVHLLVGISKMDDSTSHALAVLLHLTRHRDSAKLQTSNINSFKPALRALSVLLHLTRHRGNAKLMTSNANSFVPVLVLATSSTDAIVRRHAIRSIQNLSANRTCRHELAKSRALIDRLCHVGRNGEENGATRHAAIGTLNNLADDPTNLIPMIHAPDCFPTLFLIARGGDADGDQGITPVMKMMAKDALAALSHWLRKVATKATAKTVDDMAVSTEGRGSQLYVPSTQPFTYQQW